MASQDKQDPLIGAIVADRYQILDVLGQGGWGVVYHGVHTLMDREVAIKLLHARFLEDDTNRKRFQQEAQAVSRLSHPNIIGVHDFGMTPEGHHFLIMDLVKGTTLANILDQEGFLSVDRALPIFIQVCSGLAHAHDNGIIHRDLKPGNIMIVPVFEGEDIVKILDFGVAKVTPKDGGRAQQLTLTGEIFGTSLYLSPEQCMGKPLDPRSDIYALGCVMYEVLAGLPPHIGENLLDTLQKHIANPTVSLRQVRENSDVPEQLDAVVLKCLQKEPGDRFQSVLEVKQALDQIKLGIDSRLLTLPLPGQEPVMPLTYSDAYPAAQTTGQTYASLAGAGPGYESQSFSVTNQPPGANQSTEFSTTQGGQAGQPITQGGQPSLPGRQPGTTITGSDTTRLEPGPTQTLTGGAAASKSATPRNSSARLIAMICTGAVLGGIGAWFASSRLRPAPVVAGSGNSLPPARGTYSSNDEVQWKDLLDAGQKAYDQGKYDEAEKKFLEAAKQAEKFGRLDRRLARSLQKVSDVYYTVGRDADAELVDQKIKNLRGRPSTTEAVIDQPGETPDSHGIANHQVSDRHANLARVCHQGGQCEKAEELLQRSVDISKKAFGENSPQVAERLNDLAAFYLSMGMYDKAEPLFQQVLETEKKAPAATKALAKTSAKQYARLLRETDRQAEAKKIEAGAKGI